ncbi:MAG: glutathione S-transferase family protein [Sphingomonadaceae bacterium]|nr:glutathione S-transferase family protein [Sphingomonadaceae bacterium]
MHVYGGVVSPFVQRVLMTARAKGHELKLDGIPGASIQSPEFQAISPMGRIPLLELDDGRRICESSAIAAYLDETLDGPALLPGDPLERARVREIEAIATLEYATGMRPIMVHVVFGRPDSGAVADTARAQAEKGADVLDAMLAKSRAYAVGDTLTLADCILAPGLNLALVVDQVAGTGSLVNGRPNLAAYFARMCDDPVAGRSIAEMRDGFAAMLARNAAAAPAA